MGRFVKRHREKSNEARPVGQRGTGCLQIGCAWFTESLHRFWWKTMPILIQKNNIVVLYLQVAPKCRFVTN